MSRASRIERARAAGRDIPAAAAPVSTAGSPDQPGRGLLWVFLAALTTLGVLLAPRLLAPEPWSYDEYFHLGLARQLWQTFPVRTFPWTPFSLWSAHFADKEVLFHLLLMPIARLPLEIAGTLGALLGQVFVVAAWAWSLTRLRVPGKGWFVLSLAALGPMSAYRMSMCRPHLLLLGFSILMVALLATRARPWVVGIVCALFGLAHAGGWVAIPMAVAFALGGSVRQHGATDRTITWHLVAATALGWLAGQLLHPNLPYNFWLLWVQNVTVPLQSAPGGEPLLQAMLGAELTRPETGVLLQQWPAFVPWALALGLLGGNRALRTRSTLATTGIATVFLAAGSLLLQRMFELGAPLGVLALGLVLVERDRLSPGAFRRLPRWALALSLLVAIGWSYGVLLVNIPGRSAPRPMAQWLGTHATEGERIFTAQWGDSAPIFYFAPQARTLVALDPTFFWLQDKARFDDYANIAFGRDVNPALSIQKRFGANLVTIQKMPDFQALAISLSNSGAERVYDDPAYQVWRLSPPASTSAR